MTKFLIFEKFRDHRHILTPKEKRIQNVSINKQTLPKKIGDTNYLYKIISILYVTTDSYDVCSLCMNIYVPAISNMTPKTPILIGNA